MSKWIEIKFHGPFDPEGGLNIHRIRNFAEHLVWPLHRDGLGVLSMDDADRTIDKIRISGIRTRMLRRSIAFIEKEIVEQGFSGDATITHGTDDEG